MEERAERWGRDVKRDVDTPDLWAEHRREREILTGAGSDDVENTPFTPEEQAEIAVQLRQIKEYVKETYSLSEAGLRSLEAKLDFAQAAAAHIGRKEWRLLFLGLILEKFFDGLVPQDAVRDILTMALHGLEPFLRGGGIPPLLPP